MSDISVSILIFNWWPRWSRGQYKTYNFRHSLYTLRVSIKKAWKAKIYIAKILKRRKNWLRGWFLNINFQVLFLTSRIGRDDKPEQCIYWIRWKHRCIETVHSEFWNSNFLKASGMNIPNWDFPFYAS